jgi:hypothetical protein
MTAGPTSFIAQSSLNRNHSLPIATLVKQTTGLG